MFHGFSYLSVLACSRQPLGKDLRFNKDPKRVIPAIEFPLNLGEERIAQEKMWKIQRNSLVSSDTKRISFRECPMNFEKIKPKHIVQKWGWGLLIFGLVATPAGGAGLIFVALGIYLIWAQGPQDYFDKRRKDKVEALESKIQSALANLEKATGAQAFIAYERLESLLTKKRPEGSPSLSKLLESINFDKSRIESKFLGSLTNNSGILFGSVGQKKIRIYQQWVIAGDLGYDFDISTRGNVSVDGSIQLDKNNNKVDMRTATLQLATQEWSHAFKILPDEADEARRILNQLVVLIETLKPQALTAGDIKTMMEKLMSSSGKSPAEKLEELSNLRYQRLLSDQEFESAKSKILGI